MDENENLAVERSEQPQLPGESRAAKSRRSRDPRRFCRLGIEGGQGPMVLTVSPTLLSVPTPALYCFGHAHQLQGSLL